MSVVPDTAASVMALSMSTYSWSHTCGALANYLVVTENNAAGTGGVTPTSVTYNGVALTLVPGSSIIGGSFFESSIWVLASPPTGAAHNIVVTLPATQNYIGSGSVSFSGVNLSAPFGTPATFQTTASNSAAVTASGAGGAGLYVATCMVYSASISSNSPSTNEWAQPNISASVSASGDVQAAANGAFVWTPGTGMLGATAVALALLGTSSGAGNSNFFLTALSGLGWIINRRQTLATKQIGLHSERDSG